MSSSASAQALVRPGEAIDLYYYDHETSKKQVWPTSVNTKYVQQFNNLSGGTSVFTIPPQQGMQDVICSFVLPELSSTDADGLALNRGWGYQLINRVSFRYGGSSQYFMTGQQVLQNAVRRQPSREAASDILTLGGAAAGILASGGTNTLTTGDQYASVVLTLPHATPSGVGKAHPFPSDLLTQQIQVTVELNAPASLYNELASATTAAPPTSLKAANFQVQQVILNNAGDALARRVDMAENAYAFPAEFVQQQQTIALANSADPQSVVLTGFRSGEVKSIQLWLYRQSDVTAGNPWNWQLPLSVEMSYAGDIYARFDGQSSTLWNMVNGSKYPGFQSIVLSDAGANFTGTSAVSTYVELPFAQSFVDEDAHHVLVHGKPITNGIVNLLLQTPSAQSDWVIGVSYVYNTTLLMSQGTADYVF